MLGLDFRPVGGFSANVDYFSVQHLSPESSEVQRPLTGFVLSECLGVGCFAVAFWDVGDYGGHDVCSVVRIVLNAF